MHLAVCMLLEVKQRNREHVHAGALRRMTDLSHRVKKGYEKMLLPFEQASIPSIAPSLPPAASHSPARSPWRASGAEHHAQTGLTPPHAHDAHLGRGWSAAI